MPRNPGIPHPGSVFRPSLTFVYENHAMRPKTNPNAVQVNWWRAKPNPSYDQSKGRPTYDGASDGMWIRTQETGEFWAVIQGEKVMRRYFQPGTWETGDIAILFDPNEMDLSEYDWIVQVGQGNAPPGAIDARTFRQKHVLVRGAEKVACGGTVSVTGVNVVGVGSSFLSDFSVGDLLALQNGFTGRVDTVLTNTTLTLAGALPGNVVGMAYKKAVERTLYSPVARLVSVETASTVYVVGVDVEIAQDLVTLNWLGANQPAPGEKIAVSYDYYTRYVITDLGQKDMVVRGTPLLSLVVGRLWKPERLNQ